MNERCKSNKNSNQFFMRVLVLSSPLPSPSPSFHFLFRASSAFGTVHNLCARKKTDGASDHAKNARSIYYVCGTHCVMARAVPPSIRDTYTTYFGPTILHILLFSVHCSAVHFALMCLSLGRNDFIYATVI